MIELSRRQRHHRPQPFRQLARQGELKRLHSVAPKGEHSSEGLAITTTRRPGAACAAAPAFVADSSGEPLTLAHNRLEPQIVPLERR